MKIVSFLLLMGLATSCSIKVQTLYDRKVDFAKYKTFCWMKGCEFQFTGPAYLNEPEVRQKIQNAIVEEMADRGLVLNNDQPDLLVDVHVTVEDEKIQTYHRTEEKELYYRLFDEPTELLLLKGTLVIDMADKNEGRMVWRSVAVSYLDLHPQLTERNIRRAMKRTLRDFPPRKKTTSPAP